MQTHSMQAAMAQEVLAAATAECVVDVVVHDLPHLPCWIVAHRALWPSPFWSNRRPYARPRRPIPQVVIKAGRVHCTVQ